MPPPSSPGAAAGCVGGFSPLSIRPPGDGVTLHKVARSGFQQTEGRRTNDLYDTLDVDKALIANAIVAGEKAIEDHWPELKQFLSV